MLREDSRPDNLWQGGLHLEAYLRLTETIATKNMLACRPTALDFVGILYLRNDCP